MNTRKRTQRKMIFKSTFSRESSCLSLSLSSYLSPPLPLSQPLLSLCLSIYLSRRHNSCLSPLYVSHDGHQGSITLSLNDRIQEKRVDYTYLIYKPDEKDTTIRKQKKSVIALYSRPIKRTSQFSIFFMGGKIEKC